jgi:D-alanyl-D-alanine carboxypeptidase
MTGHRRIPFNTVLVPHLLPRLFLGGVLLLGMTISQAQAAPSLVMDVDTGRVLFSEEATDPWFPASVTKLMTAYVALKEAKEGRITLDTPLIVTKRASSASPSKMGLRAGTQVTLDNALKMVMVKSANDMAVTVAEGVGGSVESFAVMMNREAVRLGMRESYFVNPHGLPNAQQKSSARDLAILGRALLQDFPEHNGLWGIGAIQHGTRVMANTNGLIGRYYGAEGMKTGFICSSGFNVVATASRGGRRLLVVVLGSPSASERTIKAGELLDRGFTSSGSLGASLYDLPQGYGSPPDKRSEICSGKRRSIPLEDESEVVFPGTFGVGGNTENAALEMLIPQAGGAVVTAASRRARMGGRNIGTPIVVYTGPAPGVNIAARGPEKLTQVAVRPEDKTSKTRTASRTKQKNRDVPAPQGVPSIMTPDETSAPTVASLAGARRSATKPRPLLEGDEETLTKAKPVQRPGSQRAISGQASPSQRASHGAIRAKLKDDASKDSKAKPKSQASSITPDKAKAKSLKEKSSGAQSQKHGASVQAKAKTKVQEQSSDDE